jgi:hypothetical protein
MCNVVAIITLDFGKFFVPTPCLEEVRAHLVAAMVAAA